MNANEINIEEMEERYSHLIYFFESSKETAQEIADKLKESFDIEVYDIRKTKQKNYKAKIAVHEADVCSIACELTAMRKNIFVYDWAKLRENSKENGEIRKRFYRDFRYLCSVLRDDEDKSCEDITALIENGEIYENGIVKAAYESMTGCFPKDSINNMALGVINKMFNGEN